MPIGFLKEAWGNLRRIAALSDEVAQAKLLAARLLIEQMRGRGPVDDLRQVEFRVFSQFGDDGIIQYLLQRCGIGAGERRFIEFGVQDYEEANTRFLLVNDNWQGLVIDADAGNIRHIRSSPVYWRHDLTALCSFIDAANIDGLISSAGFAGEPGLLSVDLDGNDYWVWERIECVRPVIVVAEYNGVFGAEHAVSVPYDPAFRRTVAHASNLYWGCSIRALSRLAARKGYALVGSNSAGNNAYFVRRDRLADLRERDAADAYVESRFRESRDAAGNLSFLSGAARLREIRDMPVCLVENGTIARIADLYH